MKICAFASGNGSNFQVLVENGIKIDLLICNRKDAYVFKRAQNLNVEAIYVTTLNKSIKEYELEILEILKSHNIELIVLAGYMKMISKTLIDAYPNKIVNIHPSYLPDYKGVGAIENAFNDKVEYSGVSIHYIDKNMDEGVLLAQEKVYLLPEESLHDFETKIHRKEHEMYHVVIKKILSEEL